MVFLQIAIAIFRVCLRLIWGLDADGYDMGHSMHSVYDTLGATAVIHDGENYYCLHNARGVAIVCTSRRWGYTTLIANILMLF